MSQISNKIEKIRSFPDHNFKFLNKIYDKLNKIINGKRKIMYLDIINYISREGYDGDKFHQLILWCNYKIRIGEIFIEFCTKNGRY